MSAGTRARTQASRRTRAATVGLVLLAGVAGPGAPPLTGQAGPPSPGDPPPLVLPEVEQTTLSSGARLVLLPAAGPRLHLEVVVPGGMAADAPGAGGAAALLAQLLGEGTATRSAAELRQAFDRLGVSFRAGATPDHLSLGLRVGIEQVDEALALLGEILRSPALPEEGLARARGALAGRLREGLASDGRLAGEVFSSRLYGDDPWGRRVSAEAVEVLTREDLVDYHARVVRPGRALIVATGPVELAGLRDRLEGALRGWEGQGVPLPDVSGAGNPAATEILIVDRPDAGRALVVGGLLLPETDAEGWAALRVANRILGGGPGSRLERTLRDERGYTASAESSVVRRRGGGLLQVAMTVRPRAAGAAAAEVLNQIVTLRDQPVTAGELAEARSGELGRLYLGLETPAQRLDRAVEDLLQGRAADAVEELALRIPRVEPQGLQEVFRAAVNPGEMLFVAVGNAALLREQLAPLGIVTVVEGDGSGPVTAAVAPRPEEAAGSFLRVDGGALDPLEVAYTIFADGGEVGSVTRTLEAAADSLLRLRSVAELGGQEVIQSVTVRREGLRFVEASTEVRAGGRVQRGEVRREGDRIVGVQDTPAGPIEVDIVAGGDVVVSDMVELVLWAAELEPGSVVRVPMANLRTGRVETATMAVGESRILDLPAGPVEAYRVDLSGPERQTFWARVRPPHLVVLTVLPSPPLEIVLQTVRELPAGGADGGPGSGPGGVF